MDEEAAATVAKPTKTHCLLAARTRTRKKPLLCKSAARIFPDLCSLINVSSKFKNSQRKNVVK